MKVLVVLGNRLNDDATGTEIMHSRLKLALLAEEKICPDKIVVSGGVANPVAKISEAEYMKTWLVENGVAEEKIICEDNSMTTKENAILSLPIVVSLKATELILCTTPEHMNRFYLNPKRLFKGQIKKSGAKLVFKFFSTEKELDALKQ